MNLILRLPLRILLILALLGVSPSFAAAQAAEPGDSDIRVAVVDFSDGDYEGPKQIMSILRPETGFACDRLLPQDVIDGKLQEVGYDLVILPGGSGSGQAKALGEQGTKHLVDFVDQGGGHMGVCAGAYLASSHYSWSLDLINAEVRDTKHWNRGTGNSVLDFTPAGQSLLDHESAQGDVFYGQGPLRRPATIRTCRPTRRSPPTPPRSPKKVSPRVS